MFLWLVFVAQLLFILSMEKLRNAPSGEAIVVIVMLQWAAVLFTLLGAIIGTRAKTSAGTAVALVLSVGAFAGSLALFSGT